MATLSSSPQMLRRIIIQNGQMSVDIFKKSFVRFKQLRSIELSNAVSMADFGLWEVLGTLPSLENLTLDDNNPPSDLVHAPENSDASSQTGCSKYFVALESLCVSGSFLIFQHLLSLIDSPCLKSIEVYQYTIRKYEDLTPSITIVASKWSQSLKKLIMGAAFSEPCNAIPKYLMLLTDLHEMQTFELLRWKMENIDDDVRRLVMSWPKLRTLAVLPSDQASTISLSTLRIIAESCPELRHLSIQLDISTVPPFDISSKSLAHKLEFLDVGDGHSYVTQTSLQIRMARHLDSIFPYLKSIQMEPNTDATWSGINDLVKLCQDLKRGQ